MNCHEIDDKMNYSLWLNDVIVIHDHMELWLNLAGNHDRSVSKSFLCFALSHTSQVQDTLHVLSLHALLSFVGVTSLNCNSHRLP